MEVLEEEEGILPEKELEFKAAFELLSEGKNEINLQDIRRIMKTIGLTPTEDEVKQMLKEVDEDGNNTIELDEFVKLMEYKMKDEDTEQLLFEAFSIFDSENTGFINKTELLNIFDNLNVVKQEDMQRLLNSCRTDKTEQQVSYEDLVKKLYY